MVATFHHCAAVIVYMYGSACDFFEFIDAFTILLRNSLRYSERVPNVSHMIRHVYILSIKIYYQ